MKTYRKSRNSMFLLGMRATTLVVVLYLLLSWAQEGQAGIIIQNKQDATYQILLYSPIGQTFTAEDAHISSIGFKVKDFNPEAGPIALTVELFEGVGTGGLSLGSAPITGLNPGFNGFFDADFSSVTLTVGQVYTAIVSSKSAREGVGRYQWAYTDGTPFRPDPYTGGDLIFQGNVHNYCDSTFRVIPEPATISLLALGGLALIRKRRVSVN